MGLLVSQRTQWLLIGTLAVGSGFLISVAPEVGLSVALGTPVVLWGLVEDRIRFVIMVLGGLLLFQSDLNTLKLIYMVVILVYAAASYRSVWKAPGLNTRRAFSWLIYGMGSSIFVLVVSVVVSLSHGISATAWIRDSLPYVLLVLAPIVGLAAGLFFRPSVLYKLLGFLGVVSAIGLTFDWLSRRGVSALPIGRFVLSSASIVSLALAVAVVMSFYARRRLVWICVICVMVVALLLSGSRSILVLGIVFAGVCGSAAKGRVPGWHVAAIAGAAAIACIVLAPPLASLLISDPHFLDSRVGATLTVLEGSADSDGSFNARQLSYSWVYAAFSENAFLGTGPGYVYPNGSSVLDAPLLPVAKFGILGSLVLVVFLVLVARCVRTLSGLGAVTVTLTSARGWVLSLAALTPFGPWVEDKGFALSVGFLCAMVAAEWSRSQEHLDQRIRRGVHKTVMPLEKDARKCVGEPLST